MGELLFTIAMLVIFGVFFHGAGQIETARSVDPIGPAPVPEAVIAIGALLCAPLIIGQVRRLLGGKGKGLGKVSLKTVALLVFLVVFLLALETVGFYLSAVALFFALSTLLGNTSLPRCALTSVATATGFVLLFGKILSVPLPRGEGVFRVFSHWLF